MRHPASCVRNSRCALSAKFGAKAVMVQGIQQAPADSRVIFDDQEAILLHGGIIAGGTHQGRMADSRALCNNLCMSILPLSSTEATLETAGGKGANLSRLTRAGFRVPQGFIISTDHYREFVRANRWVEEMLPAADSASPEDAHALEKVSSQIRAAFAVGKVPAPVEGAILAAYAEMGTRPAAVRSSATAEDLPDLSFAGQQDTYLNVIGPQQLLEAVVQCWSSLWTARAIGYRARNGIDHRETALAVVVQEMVESESSGVMFTANPLTGLRSESVIDATLGLGEALVAGQVEPDHYVVDTRGAAIVSRTIGAKTVSTRSTEGGGVEMVEEQTESRPALSDEDILRLAAIGSQIQREFGFPQDVEWALAGGELYILQSRPITSLFPVPELSFDPLVVWLSFGGVQGLLGPITPLGIDTIRTLIAGAASIFAPPPAPDGLRVFAPAGQRLWVRISDLIRHPIGGHVFERLVGFIEPNAKSILEPLMLDPQLGARRGRLKLSTLVGLTSFILPVLPRILYSVLEPERARARLDGQIEAQLATAEIAPASDRFGRLQGIVHFARQRLANLFPFLLPRFLSVIGPGLGSLVLLNKFAGEEAGLALEVTRGLPNNVTTQMDLALWQASKDIRADPDSAAVFAAADTPELARRYLQGTLPPALQNALTGFMEKYGMRGVGEIDIGQPRWREDPTPILHTLQSYLEITDEFAPDSVFERGHTTAQEAVEKLAAKARRELGGWVLERVVRGAARRVRALAGVRESPKFFAVRTLGIIRHALLDVGEEFVAAGTIEAPEDLFYLRFEELDLMSANVPNDWKSLVAGRRTEFARELRRRQVPRVLVSDGRAFYEGLGSRDTGDVITGSPVSPGVAEGLVRVIFDPRQSSLAPGEILVCPGTDPAWTPLFLAAGGLITEVGGMMTHGSIVAREYGIPAVVGVHDATTRLKDGQRIRIDGTAGKIIVLNPEENSAAQEPTDDS